MKHSIVITAAAGVSPLGHDLASISANLGRTPEQSGCGRSTQLSNEHALWTIAGLDDSAFLGKRLKRKLDMFTVYGMVAAGTALQKSGLDLAAVDPHSVGIYVGNCLGGWGFTEPELKALHTQGISGMGPYVATAWFPAALQGQISLAHGFKGQSKTFSARDVAGLQALGHACEAIQRGRIQIALCGAAEDLSSSYMQTVLQKMSTAQRPTSEPFGKARNNILAEGAAFLVLESKAHAIARGATILAEITGFADRFCFDVAQAADYLVSAQQQAAGQQQGDALLVRDGVFAQETELSQSSLTLAANPREVLGQQFAVSGVMEVALVAQALQQDQLHPGSVGAQAFDGGKRYRAALVQRLSNQGQITTLGLQAA